MPKKIPEAERIGAILDHSLKRLDLSGRLTEHGVWPIWNEIVGPTIARNAQPEKIRNGTLFVKVTSPVWMQQLQYMKEMIAEKLNQTLGGDVVKNVFFLVGKLDGGTPSTEDLARAKNPLRSASQFQEKDLENIRDPETRRAFKKLFSAYSRKQK
jgi:predicted nucleic acid-binding Zn ribbon protein